MKRIIYYCDRCNQEITGNVMQLNTRVISAPGLTGDENLQGAELCAECYEIIDTAVANAIRGTRPTSKPAAEPEPVPRKSNKIKLDLGKIAALYRAGWTYEKIAREMGVSGQTIANRMKEALEFKPEEENNDND